MKIKNIIRNLLLIPVFISIAWYTAYSSAIFFPEIFETEPLWDCLGWVAPGIICSIAYAVWSGVSDKNTAIILLITKLISVPIYLCSLWHIYTQLEFIRTQGRFNFILVFYALIGCGIFRMLATTQSGIIGISSAVKGKKDENLTKKQAVLFSILGFIPWVDVVTAVVMLIKCRKKKETKI